MYEAHRLARCDHVPASGGSRARRTQGIGARLPTGGSTNAAGVGAKGEPATRLRERRVRQRLATRVSDRRLIGRGEAKVVVLGQADLRPSGGEGDRPHRCGCAEPVPRLGSVREQTCAAGMHVRLRQTKATVSAGSSYGSPAASLFATAAPDGRPHSDSGASGHRDLNTTPIGINPPRRRNAQGMRRQEPVTDDPPVTRR